MKENLTIGIVSPFNPYELRDYLFVEDRTQVLNNHCTASSVHALVFGLIKQGCKVLVFTADDNINQFKEFHGEHLDIFVVPSRVTIGRMKLRGIGLICRIYKGKFLTPLIRKYVDSIDLLHAQWTYEYADAILPFTKRIPCFCTVRDWCPYQLSIAKGLKSKIYWYLSRYVFSKIMKSKDMHIVANSFYTASCLKEAGVSIYPKLLFNPIKENFFNCNRSTYPTSPVFISIAAALTESRKNISNLLLAFAIFKEKNPNSSLWLIGLYDEKWMNTQKALGLMNGVKCFGEVNHDELKELLDNSSVLVHPSYEETFGNILLEAIARKVPVIGGKDSGAVPMVLGNGKYGCLCNVNSPQSIYEAMSKIIHEKDYQKQLVDDAFKYLQKNFVDFKVAQEHIKVYNSFLH